MIVYHRTTCTNARKIISTGFRDSVGTYMTRKEWKGVWVSNTPLDINEGAAGCVLLSIDLTVSWPDLERFEWVQEGSGYREFLVPAHILDEHGQISVIGHDTDDEQDGHVNRL